MTVKYGFYNSINGDRPYSADDHSEILHGIISNGVVKDYGDEFSLSPGSGLNVIVGTGKAWWNGLWILNDTQYVLPIPEPPMIFPRKDIIVLKFDWQYGVRRNNITIIQGESAPSPVAPTVSNTAETAYFVLGEIFVDRLETDIKITDIVSKVGDAVWCPYSKVNIPSDIDTTTWTNRLEEAFARWVQGLSDTISGEDIGILFNRLLDLEARPLARDRNMIMNSSFHLSQRGSSDVVIYNHPTKPTHLKNADRWFVGALTSADIPYTIKTSYDNGLTVRRNTGDGFTNNTFVTNGAFSTTDLSYWSGTAGYTLTAVTQPDSDNKLTMTATIGTTAPSANHYASGIPYHRVVPGASYTVEHYVKVTSAGAPIPIACTILWYTDANAYIGETSSAFVTAQTKTMIRVTGVAPDSATQARIRVGRISASPVTAGDKIIIYGVNFYGPLQILENGGFESGTTGWASHTTSSIAVDTLNKRTGTNCLKLTRTNTGQLFLRSNNITVRENTVLELSFWLKSTATQTVLPVINWINLGTIDSGETYEFITPTTTYTKYTRRFRVPPNESVAQIRPFDDRALSSGTIGDAWYIDDVKLYCVDSGDAVNIAYKFAGTDFETNKGLPNAKKTSLGMDVTSSVPGRYNVSLLDRINNRVVTGSFTVQTANVLARHTVEFPEDLSGFVSSTDTHAITMFIWLRAGQKYSTGSALTWKPYTTEADLAPSQVNWGGSTTDYFTINRVQFETGKPTEYVSLSDMEERRRCLTYYESNALTALVYSYGSGYGLLPRFLFEAPKRVSTYSYSLGETYTAGPGFATTIFSFSGQITGAALTPVNQSMIANMTYIIDAEFNIS